ncbi:MAG: Fis family transcriptional regulator [Deltaproteobacteria bacterium]|nr:Fis family transcriptional regulator [Deltaproteobacteria bacterium]
MGVLGEAAAIARERLGHEAEDLTVDRLVVGLFFTGVKLSNGAAGVSFTPIKEIPEAVCCPTSAARAFDPTRVRGTKVKSLLGALKSKEPIKTAVAIAALNALSATCWTRGLTGGHAVKERMDALEAVKMPRDKSVALVGAFIPTLRALKKRGGQWWVVEQDPRTLREDELTHYVPAEQSDEVIRQADVLIVTGVTLINHTLEPILRSAKAGAEIAVIGPTASLLPEPLFRRGVRVVGGVRVNKPDEVLDVLASGGSGYHLFDDLAVRIVIEREP